LGEKAWTPGIDPENRGFNVEFDNSFEVPLPPAEAWTVLMDIRRIAPCMPGAELTEVVDDRNYKGKVAVRLGPVALAFAGLVTFETIDNAARSARVKAQGTDAKGRGGAHATATFRVEEAAGGGSKVLVHTDLSLSGSVAQYGRGVGMIQATAAQIMNQFASNLKAQIARDGVAVVAPPLSPASEPGEDAASPRPHSRSGAAPSPPSPPASPPPPAAKPISGFSLMAKVFWDSIKRLFTRRPAS
jgi:carbon monoxide dehydrogenase subunit G